MNVGIKEAGRFDLERAAWSAVAGLIVAGLPTLLLQSSRYSQFALNALRHFLAPGRVLFALFHSFRGGLLEDVAAGAISAVTYGILAYLLVLPNPPRAVKSLRIGIVIWAADLTLYVIAAFVPPASYLLVALAFPGLFVALLIGLSPHDDPFMYCSLAATAIFWSAVCHRLGHWRAVIHARHETVTKRSPESTE